MQFHIKPGAGYMKVEMRIDNLNQATAKGIRHAFYDIGKDLIATAKKNILKRPRAGRTYIVRTGTGRTIKHTASKPGESPASMTGALWRSLDFEVRGADSMEFGYRESFSANPRTGKAPSGRGGVIYGKYLEDGTRRMAARPGLLIAINGNRGNMHERFVTGLKRELT